MRVTIQVDRVGTHTADNVQWRGVEQHLAVAPVDEKRYGIAAASCQHIGPSVPVAV